MKLHELEVTSKKQRKRVGRGIGSGYGKTAGRGTKGQGARTGKKLRPGFEGGQNPLAQRIPKLRGFKSKSPKAQVVTTGMLNSLTKKTVTVTELHEAGLIRDTSLPVKVLLKGEIKKPITLKLIQASAAAAAAITAAGGTIESK